MKYLWVYLFSAASAAWAVDPVLAPLLEHAARHSDGKAPHSFESAAYAGDLSHLPIGVFDSGIGGLTVLEAILGVDAFDNSTLQPGADGRPDFANERFIYFGDQANMPYGNYPKAGRSDYLRELILRDAVFLLGKQYMVGGDRRFDKPPVKAIVIACNTATAFGLDDIRSALKTWGLPVIVVGVVEAGARGVREAGGDPSHAVAVMATAGTCASGAYPQMIGSTLGLAGRKIPDIVQQGGVRFAAVIEGDTSIPQTVADEARGEVRQLLESHRNSGSTRPIGTVVLGCTHYPLALTEIERAFDECRADQTYAGLIAAKLEFVDPARWTATELFRELAKARMRASSDVAKRPATHSFFMSVANADCPLAKLSPDGGLDHDYKYGRMPGNFLLEDTRVEPMMPDRFPPASQSLVENKLPLVWRSLAATAALSE